jgi:hypothetical protein
LFLTIIPPIVPGERAQALRQSLTAHDVVVPAEKRQGDGYPQIAQIPPIKKL